MVKTVGKQGGIMIDVIIQRWFMFRKDGILAAQITEGVI
jgi:hypothetical protein